jgi:hypothetical protein
LPWPLERAIDVSVEEEWRNQRSEFVLYTTPVTTTADTDTRRCRDQFQESATSNNAALTVNAATRLLSVNPASLSFGNVTGVEQKVLSSTLRIREIPKVTVSSVGISGA